MAEPIWKDHFSNLGAYASRYFRVRVGTTTIYSGRAYRAEASGNLYVRINDICADYMAQLPAGVPSASEGSMTFPVAFTVQSSSNGSSWSTVETVSFDDNWSYDTGFSPSSQGMAFPITGRVDTRQSIYQTRYASGSVTATARYGSATRSITLSLNTGSGYNADIRSLLHAGVGYVVFNCAQHATYNGAALTSVTIGLTTYTVTDKCPRYALLYKNPFGGYDTLLIEGGATRNRSVQRSEFRADYDNTVYGREGWDFQNEVTETWTLNTGLLTMEESARMPYLLDSPDVFLWDLDDVTHKVPCIIATDSYSAESYNIKGNRMRNHTFQVRVAQNQYRR